MLGEAANHYIHDAGLVGELRESWLEKMANYIKVCYENITINYQQKRAHISQ